MAIEKISTYFWKPYGPCCGASTFTDVVFKCSTFSKSSLKALIFESLTPGTAPDAVLETTIWLDSTAPSSIFCLDTTA